MDVKEAILERHSVRKYTAQVPEHNVLVQVMEAARMAPTACNRQPFRLVCVTTPELREKVTDSYKNPWIKTAPVVIVVIADHSKGWVRSLDNKEHSEIDATIATDHMTLRATELGLGTCWVCYFDAAKVHDILNLSASEEAIALLPIGYPDSTEEAHPKVRKAADEVYSFA